MVGEAGVRDPRVPDVDGLGDDLVGLRLGEASDLLGGELVGAADEGKQDRDDSRDFH